MTDKEKREGLGLPGDPCDPRDGFCDLPEGKNEAKDSNLPRPKRFISEILSWLMIIVVAFVTAFLLNKFIIINAQITSGSMHNTIMTSDRVLGLRTVYWFRSPERGEIVFFRYPDDESLIFVKRVIGLPGDKVEIKHGQTYVNDQLISEPYLAEPPRGLDFGPYYVPEDSYFVMGDNRNHSNDARYWTNTYVTKENILGKALITYYPRIHKLE